MISYVTYGVASRLNKHVQFGYSPHAEAVDMSDHPFQRYISARLPDDLLPPHAPMLKIRQTDSDIIERNRLSNNLRDLEKFSKEFSEAVALFDTARNQQFLGEQDPKAGRSPGDYSFRFDIWNGWIFLAAKQAGVTVRNFGWALDIARLSAGRIADWRDRIDLAALKQVKRDFDARFPNIRHLRDALSHPEVYSNPEEDTSATKFADDGFVYVAEGSGGVSIQSSINGRNLVATFKGIVVSVEISKSTARSLIDLTQRAYAAVAKVSF